MHFRKGHTEITVMEAVDNLSHMAEIDLTAPAQGEKVERLTEEQVSEQMHALSWHDPEYFLYHQERVKETFRVILRYMQDLHEKDKGQLRTVETQKALQAMILLAQEGAEKLDRYTEMFKGGAAQKSVQELKEFKELMHFYKTKVFQRYQALPEVEEDWKEEWEGKGEEEILEIQRRGLRDLETVRRDREYELFFIQKEDGRPFFSRDLLRHIRLVGQFDESLTEALGEDPFLRIKIMQDRDLHQTAQEILKQASPYIDDFYKEALRHKDSDMISSTHSALMALMLAANTRNLMQNAAGKSSVSYYADYHHYVRRALMSNEYKRFVAYPPPATERFLNTALKLLHLLSASLYLRIGSHKEMKGFIHHLVERGAKGSVTQKQTSSPLSLWNTLADEDEHIRYVLKQFPNGPLMKTMDALTEESSMQGFDPLSQENVAGQLYLAVSGDFHITCARMPSPTWQKMINQAEIIDEFIGFLRSLSTQKKEQRLLMFNLQDRTSWQEHARCNVIEQLQKRAEFADTLTVVTLPKNTDFYWQASTYMHLNEAALFKQQLHEQVVSGEQCGFFFPTSLDKGEILAFSEKAIDAIHRAFFDGKATLLRKNRIDFIEIFYLFLELKCIEMCKPDTISFTCKDTVDFGSVASAELFALLRMMNNSSPWTNEEREFIQWMVYSPALIVRERACDSQGFNRMVSALEVVNAEVEARGSKLAAELGKLFGMSFFKGVQVKEV